MPTAVTKPVSHIRVDDQGVAWVEGTTTKVIELVLEHLVHGSSPEEIHFQYPHLSLARIYSSLSYYYDHEEELKAQIQQRERTVAEIRKQVENVALQ